MIGKITENVMKVEHFVLSGRDFIPSVVAVRKVSLNFLKDENGNRTNVISDVRYHCVVPETLDSLTVKVPGGNPVITEQELENANSLVYLELPVEEIRIKPYEISFGSVKVSITAPYVRIYEMEED